MIKPFLSLLLVVLLAGCASRVVDSHFTPVNPLPTRPAPSPNVIFVGPPRPIHPSPPLPPSLQALKSRKMVRRATPMVLMATETATAAPATIPIGAASIQASQQLTMSTSKCMIVQWTMRPMGFAVDVSTNLTSWRTAITCPSTNFVLEPTMVVLSTNVFPSGKAVIFTNHQPIVVFVDYAISAPCKFYRIREVQ